MKTVRDLSDARRVSRAKTAKPPLVAPRIVATLFAFLAMFAVAFASVSADARSAPSSFADLSEELSPAVVNISTSQTVERPSGPGGAIPQLPEGTPFQEFFDEFFNNRRGGGGAQPRTVQSLGSGFVIDPTGIIVTNNHVIENADEITINFANGDALPAELLGTDPKTDLAVLKLTETPSSPIPFVNFGDSDVSRVGDWVIAIGNPFGLGGSVSAGIISARNRDIRSGPYDDYLQTDAAINRGNSGGPLFNMNGEVIGVNTAIYSPTGGSVGIGFAVPSNIAQTVVKQLREFGETRRGWIGVRIRQVTEDLAEGLGLDEARGALIEDVTEDGPAAKAGVEIGDVVLSFDGNDVMEMRDLPRLVANAEINATKRMVVSRMGTTQTLRLTVGRLDEGGDVVAAVAEPEPAEEEAAMASVLGMQLETLGRALRERFSLDPDLNGVVVVEVESVSAAATKGIRRGDVIVQVALQDVSTAEDAVTRIEKIRESGRNSVLLRINRDGESTFVAVRFED